MTNSMKGFRCWSAGSVGQTVYSDIGALPSDADAVFLAAHTPMTLSHLKGEEPPDAASGERQVLETLLAGVGDADRNMLIAVTGGSGAGKSHVVRWVHAHLDPADQRFHVLYVPRAVQTIRELLRRIVRGLPGGGGQELLERIDAAVGNTTSAELQDRLLEEMRLALTWALELRPPREDEDDNERAVREDRNSLLGYADKQGKRRNGLADLLALPDVNRVLLRPEGRLHRLVESLYSETSRRDEQQESFASEDLPLREPGVRRALAGNSDLRELWDIIRQDARPALDVLDEALRLALPKTLGLQVHNGETLDSLFHHSRQALRDEGKELVLLFEDLTQFGLVDGALYDQFVTQPGPDLAPLRVLFAVTDGPYKKLPETVQTRITHRFSVDSSALTNRAAFVARYLNLVRIGRSDVEAAWSHAQKTAEGDEWVRNACDTLEEGSPCRFRDECHQAFGTAEVPGLGRVGLYPYNEVALRRALDRRGLEATPRDILDVCVSEVLKEAEVHIDRGTYPHNRVKDQFDFRVQRAKDAVLKGRTGEQAERLYRALVVWGDEEGLEPTVVNAFSLDAPGTKESVTPQLTVSKKQRITPKNPEADLRRNPLLNLYQWQNGKTLPDSDADRYRDTLYHLVSSRLDLDQDLFYTAKGRGQVVLNRLFNRTSFNLEDARGHIAGAGSVRFDICREAEDIQVLMGARWFADHGHWRPGAGAWPWPEGYDPVELMLTLEHRLEEWADTVRQAFRSRVRGRGLAGAAVGTRAVALLAAGISSDRLRHVDDALTVELSTTAPSVPAWVGADRVAREVLRRVSAVELIGQFAAVRQGDTGAPQLVDAVALEEGLQEAIQSPMEHLRHVVAEFEEAEPVLVAAAQELLSAIEQATPDLLGEVVAAAEELAAGLEGQDPRVVARAAREVGRRAKEDGFFRPANGWPDFVDSLNTLDSVPSGLPLDWRRSDQEQDEEAALAVQHWGREAVRGVRALNILQQSLAATRRECTRSGGMVSNLDQRRQDVRKKLGEVEGYLQALSTAEAPRG